MGSVGMAQPARGNGRLYPGPEGGGLDDTMHLGGVQAALCGR